MILENCTRDILLVLLCVGVPSLLLILAACLMGHEACKPTIEK